MDKVKYHPDIKFLIEAIKHNYYIVLKFDQGYVKCWDNKLYIDDEEIDLTIYREEVLATLDKLSAKL